MNCTICNLPYVDKNETPFNIRLNNLMKDVEDVKAKLADNCFQKSGHSFNEQTISTIIDRLTNTNLDKKVLREPLIQRETFGYKN